MLGASDPTTASPRSIPSTAPFVPGGRWAATTSTICVAKHLPRGTPCCRSWAAILVCNIGSAPGKQDLGVGTLSGEDVLSLYEYFAPVRIEPRAVEAGQFVYYQISAQRDRLGEDHYRVFGPLPPRGKKSPPSFALSYRVLTDRPQDSLDNTPQQPTFHHFKQMSRPYHAADPGKRLAGKPPAADSETGIDANWTIHYTSDAEKVLHNAARDLQQFLAARGDIAVKLDASAARGRPRTVDLVVGKDPDFLKTIDTPEGYRVEVEETTQGLFEAVPGLWGSVVIFDSEGFRHCGMSGRKKCPRCKHRSTEDIVVELFECLHRGMKAGNPKTQMIAWSYCLSSPAWVEAAIGKLPKDIIMQAGFSQGTVIKRAGISQITTDYNITSIGPPKLFQRQFARAKKHGLRTMAKTESGASQEFLCVPYVPCMEQWYRRMAKLSQYDLDGIWGTYNHYGYTPSRPVDIMLWYSWTEAPKFDDLLEKIIARDFGAKTVPHVKKAWDHVTRAIRNYPYSNQLCRCPGGPIQKGPSQPLWLDPSVKADAPWRAWANHLKWTQPWGTKGVEQCFGMMENELANAKAGLILAKADSRFGAAGGAMGCRRGGLFNATLISYKIGLLENTLELQLAPEQ